MSDGLLRVRLPVQASQQEVNQVSREQVVYAARNNKEFTLVSGHNDLYK